MDKIDIHESEKCYTQAIKKLKQEKGFLQSNGKLILDFLEDSAIGKTARLHARKKTVGLRGRLKSLYLLKTVARFFKDKDFKKLDVKDVERLIKALNKNLLKAKKGKYSEQTKSNIKKQFIIFLRWMLGEGDKKFYDMTYWIDTNFEKKDTPSLDEDEVKEILKKCNTIKQKVLICLLFDGGFRIEELLNIRNEDVKLVDGNAPYYRIRIRTEFSKTLGRDVSLFWGESYDIVTDWINAKVKSTKPQEPFFIGTYDGTRMILKKLGDRSGLKLFCHRFRHSSASFYANQGYNEYMINKRFGWSKASDMGRYYIDEAKIDEKKQVKEYEGVKLDELKLRIQKHEQQDRINAESTKRIMVVLEALIEANKKNPNLKLKEMIEIPKA